MITHSELHYRIIRTFVDHGHAPTIAELADALGEQPDNVRDALVALQDYHGVVLHPATGEVWAAHPFSAAPTNFWVQTDRIGCWANCAWCAMGAVTLLGGSATVTSTIGAESKQVVLHVAGGVLRERGLCVHFPVPMARAWDNVIYTCSTMLLFESEAQIAGWCRRHRIPRGDVQPLELVLAFAQEWYGGHLDRDWVKWSSAEAATLFEKHGLTGPTWQVADGATRF
ncbi:MAG TPA: alkylmercury lyase family protein [Longimicrobiales bacterium]|nr:alkylmercury lyase family protein [Longimicrobiales bacterium]